MQDSAPASMGSVADYGPSSSGSFVSYVPASCSWRTWQRCLNEGWEEFLETWPTAGLMRNGECFRLRKSERPTSARGCFFLPTPAASDRKGSVSAERAAERAAESSRGVRLPE